MTDNEKLVGTGVPIHRIAAAEPDEGRSIKVTWTTGEKVSIDLTQHIATHKAFARLRVDDAFFRTMQIGEWGHDIYWPEEPDCAIPAVYLEGYAVPL